MILNYYCDFLFVKKLNVLYRGWTQTTFLFVALLNCEVFVIFSTQQTFPVFFFVIIIYMATLDCIVFFSSSYWDCCPSF